MRPAAPESTGTGSARRLTQRLVRLLGAVVVGVSDNLDARRCAPDARTTVVQLAEQPVRGRRSVSSCPRSECDLAFGNRSAIDSSCFFQRASGCESRVVERRTPAMAGARRSLSTIQRSGTPTRSP